MELNNNENIDTLVLSASNVETKIKNIQDDINTKLRPLLNQLNKEVEPSLTINQDRSITLNQINLNILLKYLLFIL